MVKYLFAKVGSAIVIGLVSAIGYTLNTAQLANIGYEWWPLIGFGFFAIIMIWVIADLYGANKQLLNARPSVKVQPLKQGNTYYLKVSNFGAEGKFRAQIALSSDDPMVSSLPQYNSLWQYGNKDEAIIHKGHDDLLKIADLYSSRPPGPISQHLEIWYFHPTARCAQSISTSSHWLGATIISSKDGTTRPITKHEYKLGVTISSSPELREGTFWGEYVLDIDGLRTDISPHSASHKNQKLIALERN